MMECIGTIAFAVSGAVVAIEKKLDYYGICFLAVITAIGGGIMRDILLDEFYPASLNNPVPALISLGTAVIVILFYDKIVKLEHLVSIADGLGLAAFTAIGARVAVVSGHHNLYSVVIMGMLTGTFGGVLRDITVKEIPRCFRREVYAVASLIGAVAFEITYDFFGYAEAMYICFGVTLAVRMVSLKMNWHLGTVKPRGEDEALNGEGQPKKSKKKGRKLFPF